MLGFSPLAAASLADDGVVAEQRYRLDAITAGAPTVDASSISQVHSLTADAITCAAPVGQDHDKAQGCAEFLCLLKIHENLVCHPEEWSVRDKE